MTVVWSLPPNCCPILGRERSVSSRHRYIAICRAVTRTRERELPHRSSMVRPKYAAVWAMIAAGVISALSSSVMRSLSTISASGRSTCWRLRLAKAVTRISAPSSSRMFVEGREPVARGLLAGDRDARVGVRGMDVGDEPPLESRPQAVLEAVGLLGRQVGRDDGLVVGVVGGVERVEERLHRLLLALQELDVV